AQALRRVVPFDRTAMFLHDVDRDVLRLFVLESSLPSSYFVVGLEMPPADSHVGWVFREQQALLRRDLGRECEYQMEDRAFADGVRSYIIVPLVARGRSIGTLAVASTTPNQYGESDAVFLQEVANQVALAVENMKAYEEITTLVTERRRADERLREVMEGTAPVTGREFFSSLVRHLASALQVPYAFVTECSDRTTAARTLAFWKRDGFGENFEYDVAETPCHGVLAGQACHYSRDVQALFPGDKDLVALEVQSYLGTPILDESGRVIGHLAVLDVKPMAEDPWRTSVLRIFSARAGAELERLHAEAKLRAALAEVEALKNRLQTENVYLQEEIRREHNLEEMVGSSAALLDVMRKVERVAPTDATVLIAGETGTGKELVARAIHQRSGRKGRALVKVNCGAISAGLVESELFGHVKGAFTGALERRVGRFELADGGTLFLDEVSELPLETQVKLLRVLQEGEFEPVGSSRTVRVDVRIIAATNRDLEEAVRAGRFRADLFYRLNVFPLTVPPLRARQGDIPQLAMFFLSRFSRALGERIEIVSPDTMARLVSYPWPGNVRELRNLIERAVVLAQEPVLALDRDFLPAGSLAGPGVLRAGGGDAPGTVQDEQGPPATSLAEVERRHIRTVLDRTGGVIEGPNGAATILNLHPNTLRSRMKKLGIPRPGHEIS
ncbi:MAG: sigma 54-interacting transcriptional regulator, partial [Actinomycetota bacterium]